MARVRQFGGRAVRPSTRTQTRKVLQDSRRLRPATVTPAGSRANLTRGKSTRVLRSTTTPTSSPLPAPTSPRSNKGIRTPKRRRARTDPWLPKRKPPKSARKERAPPPTHLTCRICAEELPIEDFIKYISPRSWRLTNPEVPYQCLSHLARNPWSKRDPVCRSCIGASMAARHDLVGARQVSSGCLEPGCNVHWDFAFIMHFFPPGEPLEKYNSDMLLVWIQDSKIVKCINEQCSAQGLPDTMAPGYPQIQCHSCSTRFCATCLVPWHKDLTCAEYAARHVNEAMSDPEKDTLKMMQEKDGKRCPNCYLVIEKDGGCNSMYCIGCQKYFDWETAASAVPGTKKAVPVATGGYWGQPMEVVCEMDALEKKKAAGQATPDGTQTTQPTQPIPSAA